MPGLFVVSGVLNRPARFARVDTNESELATTMNRFVPDLVDRCAQRGAAQTAIVEDESTLTYGALAAASAALCERLRAHGVGSEVVVAIALPRSIASIVAALAVMKAGGAYLPLDPTQPCERLRAILRDAGASLFIGDAEQYEHFSDIVAHHVAPPQPAADRPVPAADEGVATMRVSDALAADDLAYVIYTSGSSGRPKGVDVTHGSLANLVDWHRTAFGVRPQDRASHLAEVGFDAAVWEVWPYLAAGATVVIGDGHVAKNPEALAEWLCRKEVTLAYASAPMAERLMRLPWPAAPALRTLLTGADRLHVAPGPGLPFEVVNNYGPTETTVVATSGRVPPEEAALASGRFPTIGRPIANARVYVVDADGLRVAPGVEGELWIGGAGVARGYRHPVDGEAGAFGPDPFDSRHGARVFKSGDRGCLLPGGELEFAGRNDAQFKIRGYRVEPAEIERALCDHPAVVAAAVVAQGDERSSSGELRLVAYVVAPGDVPAPRELRERLTRRLPAYMLPSLFVRVAALPLTDNGKVDRATLRGAPPSDVLVDRNDDAPPTPTEEKIAGIVAPLLKLEHIGVRDNIFMLGGHSLLGTQIIARIRDAFGVRLGLRLLFESPTVAALAAEVDRIVLPARTEPSDAAAETA